MSGKVMAADIIEEQQTHNPHMTVLVVDDSKMQRKLITAHLKKSGFTILEAGSGAEALHICQTQNVDMVLSDWIMPEMDGIEFCKAFRKLDREIYGYFILLTSKSEKGDIAEGLDVGADDFLSKPVNAMELRARINAGQRVVDMHKRLRDESERTKLALAETERLYDAIQKDLVEAEKLQKSLIPKPVTALDGAVLSNLFKSSGHVGGDLVGHFPLSEDRHAIFSIDVSGHGVSSALLTIRLAGYLSPFDKSQNVAFEKTSDGSFVPCLPQEIAKKLNSLMLGELETELYFTLAFADVNLKTGHTKMVQAGHPHPVVFDANGNVDFVGAGGPPIGLIDGIDFEGFEIDLNPGQRLLLYSDGLTECENTTGDLLDEHGLDRILKAHKEKGGPELLADIVWELVTFAEGENFGDDLSAILCEFSGKTAA